ncbi:hypothetical protein SAMN05216266_101423 [Amycolatopsis marina]|uniref:PE family protein n=1 Tax=Amycolatopsis marina TaxID=490629 RepID=A0A1I0VSG6_9PSEU|nr:hypothetical protein SAMN05216266_101423 [Amycolatopsis marina]
MGQEPGTAGPQGVIDTINSPGPAAPLPGAAPMPLPPTGQVQYSQGETPAPPPDYAALGGQQAKADFAAASAGGGWEYDPEAMLGVIQSLDDVVKDDLGRMESEADKIVGIDPPGHEEVSESYVNAANRAGASWNAQFSNNKNFLIAYIDTLKEIHDAYQRQDEAALDALRGKDT